MTTVDRSAGTVQFGLFDVELDEVREQLRMREATILRERQARFEANKAKLLADTGAWKGGEFSERIDALLDRLVHAGAPARRMHDAILGGINAAAKGGRLDEHHVAFVEEKARVEVARVSTLGEVIPTKWELQSATDLTAVDPSCTQLPEAIQHAALARLNELGPGLAQLGFKSELEVDTSSPRVAQELASGIREVHTALMLLAVNRYRDAKGYKQAKAERLDNIERFASQVLGIDTKAHPGVKLDLPLTSSGMRQKPARNQAKAAELHESVGDSDTTRQADVSGIYVGKITSLSADRLEQKIGRDPRDVVVHDRATLSGDDVTVGNVVTISYEMGIGRLSNLDLAVEQRGRGR
ncbi:KfrB domain-containing protein [Cupriavidus nantongensis]|uniref:KfrB domain-containing protein n=1 Tax=Cupriavidus nantongensis TaxID=1796606 RepID=A0A142JIY8_9BURK|nr:hypothetical protein [Cupriavidus nantongensis]AMR78050.1 hypothetical protein A2G96_10010 [Cupriavidus nantongensis]